MIDYIVVMQVHRIAFTGTIGQINVIVMSFHALIIRRTIMKPFELAPLPYAYDFLEPVIDKETMQIHHDKHHQAYVNNLNAAIAKYPDLPYGCVDCILGDIANVPEDICQAVINNGGGHKNHTLFWEIMTKPDFSILSGDLKAAIDRDLGGYDAFVESFSNAAATRFGSGWAWLVVNKDRKLEVTSTANQDNPLLEGKTGILGLDVWEHAYYLHYQNRRPDYIKEFFRVINWDKVSENYTRALNSHHK